MTTIAQAVDRVAVLLVGKGNEFAPLRRLVVCEHDGEIDFFGSGQRLCQGCSKWWLSEEGMPKPFSRGSFWDSACGRDKGALVSPLAAAYPRKPGELEAQLMMAALTGDDLAALRAVAAALEATP